MRNNADAERASEIEGSDKCEKMEWKKNWKGKKAGNITEVE